MKALSENELVDLVINWVRKNGQRNANGDVEITASTNLMESGLLDSFGFIELILFIESQSCCKVDLMDVDPSEFSVLRGLCKVALRDHP
jgi:acyl carrier protein